MEQISRGHSPRAAPAFPATWGGQRKQDTSTSQWGVTPASPCWACVTTGRARGPGSWTFKSTAPLGADGTQGRVLGAADGLHRAWHLVGTRVAPAVWLTSFPR